MSSSKRYPEEFKIEAVKQVTEKGHSVSEVATRLGTTTHSLYARKPILLLIRRYDTVNVDKKNKDKVFLEVVKPSGKLLN